ncbi:MAG: PAS domain-containing protein, partial [Chloroflexota bacterium]
MSETSSLSGSLTKSTSSGKMRDLRAATYFDSLPPHLLNTIMKYMTVALAVFDWDMRYVAVSDRWLRDFEILDRNVIGKSHYDVLKVPEGRKIIHQRALAGEVLSGEMDFVVDDEKRKIWLSWMVRPWYDANGEIGGVIIITEFVTEKVRLEQELHYRETIYRTLARNYPNSGVFVFDHDLRYVLAEGESLKQQGFADNYFEGNTFYEVSTPQTIEHLESYFLDTLAGNRHHLEFLRRTGKYFDLHFVPLRDADDDVVAGMLVSRDMTEQYEARKLLEDSEKRFRSIVNDQTDLICLFNADGDIEFANSAFCDYFDVTAEQPSQTNFLVMTAQNASDEQTSLQQITPANPILETARAVPQTNLTNPPNWIHWTIRGIFDDEGNLERFQAVGHDITLRKRFGKAQKKQKAWESTLKEISSALNSTLNLDQVLERIIDNIERIVPYDAANVMLI